MDGMLGKFGIYDFMGIWGPGAITVTYYMCTLYDQIKGIREMLGITMPDLEQLYWIILLYTAVAYTVGVILHESTRIILDVVEILCNKINAVKSLVNTIQYVLGKLLGEYKERKDLVDFDKELFRQKRSRMKYDKGVDMRRIDLYHSVYALSRSLTLSFFIHFIMVIACKPHFLSVERIMIVDGILVIVFFERAYRYYRSWIKNTFIQYRLIYGEKEQG